MPFQDTLVSIPLQIRQGLGKQSEVPWTTEDWVEARSSRPLCADKRLSNPSRKDQQQTVQIRAICKRIVCDSLPVVSNKQPLKMSDTIINKVEGTG